MDVAVLEQKLDEIFDHAVVHHGYTSYMRDYEVIVYVTADPRTDVEPAYLRYLFRYCVEARCESSVLPETWRVSLDDRLIDHETGVDLDGYVWGAPCTQAPRSSRSRKRPVVGRKPWGSTSMRFASRPTRTASPCSFRTCRSVR
ncbi:hypothetical protein [Streptomyces sp. NPDC057438]|uniref:YxiG-like protein n=1 Tax=Streptomyces sp. NPDC057438 TaxID=3346133 RepID=UPI0036BAEE79